MTFNSSHIPDLAGRMPGTLIHLGAGRCRELDAWRDAGFSQIVLVEADPSRIADLRTRVDGDDKVRILDQAISAQDGQGELTILSYPDASSLRHPTRLLELFPGVRVQKRVPCLVRGINSLLAELELNPDAANGLVIDTPGEEYAITQTLAEGGHLDLLSFILLQAATVPLYEGSRTSNEVEKALLEARYCTAKPESVKQDPVRPVRIFIRDPAAAHRHRLEQQLLQERAARKALEEDLARSTDELAQQRDALRELRASLEQLKNASDEAQAMKAALEAARQERDGYQSRARELEEDLGAHKKKATVSAQAAEEARNRAAGLEQQLDKAKNDLRRMQEELEGRAAITQELKKLLEAQSEQIQQSVRAQQEAAEVMEKRFLNPILSRIDNSAKQIESYIGLNTFIETGALAPDLHGWPISPDLALYLMRRIHRKNYDLIIEFGSGSSTVLMARAVAAQLERSQLSEPDPTRKRLGSRVGAHELASVENGGSIAVHARATELSRMEVLPRIVSFEHKRDYYEKTLADLTDAGLADLVELVYAPLRDYQAPSGSQYLYYACEEVLDSVANRLGNRKARVFALIDGPPAATGPHARYPALPLLLDRLLGVDLDVLLDDYIRKEEKEVIDMWGRELDRRGHRKNLTTLPFEKGAALLEIA